MENHTYFFYRGYPLLAKFLITVRVVSFRSVWLGSVFGWRRQRLLKVHGNWHGDDVLRRTRALSAAWRSSSSR